MISMNLHGVAELVIRQAQRQGFILPRDIKTVLSEAGLSEALWKDVLAVARPALAYRKGRYYYTAPVSDRVLKEQSQQRGIQKAVRQIIRQVRNAAAEVERREQDRVDFIQQVKVKTEDRREYTLLTRDLSPTGIRLIGTRRFLGQKIHVSIPGTDGAPSWDFVVRILWTCAVGEDLVENGGTFLDVAAQPKQ
jgi:PilZ domain